MIRAGPVGIIGPKDVKWEEKEHSLISHIYVSFSKFNDYETGIVTSVQFGYLENGAIVLSPKYGSSEGHNLRLVRLDQDEYVTGLSGEPEQYGVGIRNLTFHTNRRNHGPFGYLDDNGPKVELDLAIRDRHEFGGFFGSQSSDNRCLTSIGIYMNPIARYDTVVKREKI